MQFYSITEGKTINKPGVGAAPRGTSQSCGAPGSAPGSCPGGGQARQTDPSAARAPSPTTSKPWGAERKEKSAPKHASPRAKPSRGPPHSSTSAPLPPATPTLFFLPLLGWRRRVSLLPTASKVPAATGSLTEPGRNTPRTFKFPIETLPLAGHVCLVFLPLRITSTQPDNKDGISVFQQWNNVIFKKKFNKSSIIFPSI